MIEISSDIGRYEFHYYLGAVSCDRGIARLTGEQRSLITGILEQVKYYMPESSAIAYYPWVNWVDEEEEIFNRFSASGIEGTQPVVKISSVEELNVFIAATEPHFSLNGRGMNYDESFMKLAENYDDDFFSKYSLLIAYVTEGSGSITHKVTDFVTKDGSLTMQIKRYSPMIQTRDMAGWFVTVEVFDDWIKDYTSFGAIVE